MARFNTSAREAGEYAVPAVSTDSFFELGLMYCCGRDVDLDLVEAHKWFNLAALKGNAEAKSYRVEISREMSKSQVAKAQRLAREWLALH